MVEINDNKKNIIILFISMIFVLLFFYKGFISDSDHYLLDYKNYLIKVNASQYYFDKIDKNKNNNDKNKIKDKEKIIELLLNIKNSLNDSINIKEKLIKNLNNIDYKNIKKLKSNINNTIKQLNHNRKIDNDIINIIDKYKIA